MNLFKKNSHIIASFGEKELSDPAAEIQKKLESLLPIPAGQELRLSIAESTDLYMDALCAFSYFSKKTRMNGHRVVLKARSEVIENIKLLGLESYFDDLKVGE